MTDALQTPDRASLQRRTVTTLVGSQVLGGVGLSAGIAVGALLAEEVSGSARFAGLGGTFQVLGSALVAIPMARVMAARGRRPGLVLGYALAAAGAVGLITAGIIGSFPLLLVSSLAFGGATTANSQSRYAAADLAPPDRRARDLSIVVWATTLGSVLGPNLVGPSAPVADALGLPRLTGRSSSRSSGCCWPSSSCSSACGRTRSCSRAASRSTRAGSPGSRRTAR